MTVLAALSGPWPGRAQGPDWPRFSRNSNTGGTIADEPPEAYRPATNRILHDRSHPSTLVLPIITKS